MGSAADALESYRRETEDVRGRSRDGNGRELSGAYITRLEVRDVRGGTPLLYDSGDSLVLELEAEVAPELRGKELHVQFTVDSEAGVRVFTAHSSWAQAPMIADATISVRCTIDQAYLAPGRFFVSGWVSTGGDYLDHIERAASFEIAPSTEFLHPKRIPAYGPVDFPHRFEQIEPAHAASFGGGSVGQ
jgi:hypothetical protein